MGVKKKIKRMGINKETRHTIKKKKSDKKMTVEEFEREFNNCLLYTSPSPRD